jgi:SPP1 gp7 family putative phage head morphogenesis protein
MKYLRPLILTDSLYTPIEKIINLIFEEVLFAPLRAAVRNAGIEIKNAQTIGLERALREGKVWKVEGYIYGAFNASISKELRGMGAVFDKRTKSWKLAAALPARLQIAIAEADSEAQAAVAGVIKVLDDINLEDMRTPEELKEQYGKAVFRINQDFIDATKAVAIAPELTARAQQVISDEWAQNLDLYIKGWMKDAIIDLREEVQGHVFAGGRSAGMVKSIQATHNVSKAKAKFLARQETSLLMSKLREDRYKEIGVTRYRWNGVDDSRERPDHKALNGKIFAWDQPPITNRDTGARNNPGEDYNCRCLAIPILDD